VPTSVAKLRIHLGQDPASTVDADAMLAACDAANATAVRLEVYGTDGAEWPADVDLGATMQAARWYGRRGSVQGIAAFADLGVSTIGDLDPDVRFLWGLGEYQRPVVA
jgi:hypothetical protein